MQDFNVIYFHCAVVLLLKRKSWGLTLQTMDFRTFSTSAEVKDFSTNCFLPLADSFMFCWVSVLKMKSSLSVVVAAAFIAVLLSSSQAQNQGNPTHLHLLRPSPPLLSIIPHISHKLLSVLRLLCSQCLAAAYLVWIKESHRETNVRDLFDWFLICAQFNSVFTPLLLPVFIKNYHYFFLKTKLVSAWTLWNQKSFLLHCKKKKKK